MLYLEIFFKKYSIITSHASMKSKILLSEIACLFIDSGGTYKKTQVKYKK